MRRPLLIAGLSILALTALYGTYVAGMAVWLNTDNFRALINPEDRTVDIEFGRVFSPYPEVLDVKDLVVTARHGQGLEWQARFAKARLRIDLIALWRQQVALRFAHAEDAQVRFRSGRLGAEEDQLAAQITGGKTAAASEADGETQWTFRLADLQLREVTEVWVDEYRYEGRATLSGGMETHADGKLTIPALRLTLTGGTMAVGPVTVATFETFALDGELPGFNPDAEDRNAFATRLKATIRGDAKIDSIRFLNMYLRETPSVTVGAGSGHVRADLTWRGGQLVDASSLVVSSERLAVDFLGQTAIGRGRASLTASGVEPAAQLRLGVAFDTFELNRTGVSEPGSGVTGRGLSVAVQSTQVPVGRTPEDWRLEIDLPRAEVRDAAYLGHFIPRGTGFAVVRGLGTVEAKLVATARRPEDDRGFVRVRAEGVGLRYDTNRLQGDIALDVVINAANLRTAWFDVSGSRLALTNVTSETADAKHTKWWGRLDLATANMTIGAATSVEGKVRLEAQSLRPLVAAYAAASAIPDWVLSSLAFDGLSAQATLKADDVRFEVDDAQASAEGVKIDAWFRRRGIDRNGALLVKYGALTLGLKLKGEDVDIKMIGATDWYRKTLPAKKG